MEEGVFQFDDGCKYISEQKNDLKNGKFIYFFDKGSKYVA